MVPDCDARLKLQSGKTGNAQNDRGGVSEAAGR
jgi:hypothetical protein